MKDSYVLIMAGGVGSRFWPVSRTAKPKQFIDILGTGKTLIQHTYDRFAALLPEENIFIVTNDIYKDLIKMQLPLLADHQVLCEPIMRNTAPCIAYGANKIKKINSNASIVVAPSDHLIVDTNAFLKAIEQSLEAASENDCLITLGIQPSRPDTGYGYIQYSNQKMDEQFYKVKTFTEKPNLEIAQSFLQSGDFLWNAGIFIWSANAILTAFERYLPEINEIFKDGEASYNTPDEHKFIQQAYSQCTNISIDYGIMEKANNVYVLPADFGWSDLGTWASIYELSQKDDAQNVLIPSEKVLTFNSSNCMVKIPEDKLVILSGLDDFIVVEDNNVLLICPRDQEQQIKQVVTDVKHRFGVSLI